MLPDFPDVKRFAQRQFLRAVQRQIPEHEPILRGIKSSRAHEGTTALLTRADATSANINFQEATAELSVSREQMRSITAEQLMEHIVSMSRQFADHQVRQLFSRVSEAVEEIGNSVSARELGAKEAFLEMNRRLEVSFDPETLEPMNQVIVLHPSQVVSFKAQVDEWQQDPEFVAEMNRIRQQQLEAWRAREDSRKLVD